MLPGQFISGRIRIRIRKTHHSVTQKIIGEAGIAEIRRAHPEYVALGNLPFVRKLQRITLVRDFRTPVGVIVFIPVMPVSVVSVGILVPKIIDLELALAVISKFPADALTERDAVFRPQIETGITPESPWVQDEIIGYVIDVLR